MKRLAPGLPPLLACLVLVGVWEALARLLAVDGLPLPGQALRALPLLLDSPRPRLIDVTSDAAVEAYEGWGGYGAGKAALEHLGAVLAVEYPNLTVWSIDPGDLRTAMHQAAFPGEDISDRPEPASVVPAFLELIRSDRPSGRYRAAELVSSGARS